MTIDYPTFEQISGLRTLWEGAFGDTDAFLDSFFETAFSPLHCRCITDNGQVLAALYWFDCVCGGSKIAYIYAVATQKASRGQGLCSRLMEDTHTVLSQTGYAGALLVPGSEGLFRFYEKMGYKVCTYRDRFAVTAADTPAAVQALTPDAFAAKRARMLPASAVVQDGENLAFLAGFADFYSGDNFLLAAHREQDTLVGIELLGDASNAAGIVKALGCAKGEFYTPGDTLPFSMYYPLHPGKEPTYFGFAFD